MVSKGSNEVSETLSRCTNGNNRDVSFEVQA